MWKKSRASLSKISEKGRELLLKVSYTPHHNDVIMCQSCYVWFQSWKQKFCIVLQMFIFFYPLCVHFNLACYLCGLTLQEHFGGSALIVPDLEGMLYLKEDGKKVWKPRYFMLRASGIYFVPKGKTKVWQTKLWQHLTSYFFVNANKNWI